MLLELLEEFCNKHEYRLRLDYYSHSAEYDVCLVPQYGVTENNQFYTEVSVFADEEEIRDFLSGCEDQLKKIQEKEFERKFSLDNWRSYAEDKDIYYRINDGGLSNYASITVTLVKDNARIVEYFETQDEFLKRIMEPLEKEGYIWTPF